MTQPMPSISPVPSQEPSLSPTLSPTAHPTLEPTSYPTKGPGPPLVYVGDDNNDDTIPFPLSKCEGDCDEDEDCEGDLICFSSSEDWVPGCSGTIPEEADGETDFCIDPDDEPAGGLIGPTPNSFQLKMYWEDGYYWQESRSEKKYCMERSGEEIKVQKCDRDNTFFEFLNLNNGVTQIKIADKDLCFEIVGNNAMELRSCEASTERQQFVAINGSFQNGEKFEIGTVFRPGGCLSQQHHPRPGEEIKRVECPNTRDDDTSYWTKY